MSVSYQLDFKHLAVRYLINNFYTNNMIKFSKMN